jgi:hypothetical protein
MDKIDLDKIKDKLKKYPPCLIAKETGFTYPHIYKFLRNITDNPTTNLINAMIDFINKNESK